MMFCVCNHESEVKTTYGSVIFLCVPREGHKILFSRIKMQFFDIIRRLLISTGWVGLEKILIKFLKAHMQCQIMCVQL